MPLKEELRILNLYLEIERARFEDRLRVVYEVPASLQDATGPEPILQPLVENSIRHGIGRRAGPGYITVAAESEGDTLVVRVTDNGAGFDDDLKQPSPEGVGLSITRGRLESLRRAPVAGAAQRSLGRSRGAHHHATPDSKRKLSG